MMRLQEAALVCASIGVLLYMNTIDCGFCFDDHSAVEENRDLLPTTPWLQLLQDDFWGTPMSERSSHKSYRPLTVVTYRLNYMLHELQPLGYHLVNVLLHSAVCYLYVLLCGVVFSEVWPALIAGLLFAVHPIHTEAVAGLVGRAEILCSIFYLVTILCYKKTTEKPGCTDWKWLFAATLSMLFSSLSKEQGITVMAVCLIYDVFYCLQIDIVALVNLELRLKLKPAQGEEDIVTSRLKPFVRRAAILLLCAMGFMVLRLKIMGGTMPTFYLQETNPAALEPTPFRQLHWLYLCFSNVWLLLSPSSLCADWTSGTIPLIHSLIDLRNLATLLLFGTIAVLITISIKRERSHVLFSFALLILPYLPASNLFFPVGFVVAERVLYLPSMGFCMLVSLVYRELMNRGKKWTGFLKPALFLLLLTQSMKTVQRNRDWYSEHTLWRSAISVNPYNSKVFTNLAKMYEQRNDIDMTLMLARHALELQPNVMLQWINVALIYKSQGQFHKAEEHLREAMALVPQGKRMSVSIGSRVVNVYGELANIIKFNTSRLEEAIVLFSKALSLEVTPFMQAHWMMEAGNCYLHMDNFERAKISFMSAYEVNPQSLDTNYNLGVVYSKEDKFDLAETYLRRALAIKRDHLSSITALASILSDSGGSDRHAEAFDLYEQAVKMEPTNYKPLWRIGNLHLKRREFAEARNYYYRALQLNPSSVQVLYSLGKLFSEQGLFENAVEVLERVLTAAPNSHLGASLLAKAYRESGNVEKAIQLERRVSEDVSRPSSEDLVLSARQQILQRNFKTAESYYREALASNSGAGRAELLLEIGSFLVQRKKCSEAVKHLFSALEILEKGVNEGRAMSESEREMRERVVAELQYCSQGSGREEKNTQNNTAKDSNFSTGHVKNVHTVENSRNADIEEHITEQDLLESYHH